MIYSNVDFNVVYIDPSIETPGDGTTPAGALKALPAMQFFSSAGIDARTPEEWEQGYSPVIIKTPPEADIGIPHC